LIDRGTCGSRERNIKIAAISLEDFQIFPHLSQLKENSCHSVLTKCGRPWMRAKMNCLGTVVLFLFFISLLPWGVFKTECKSHLSESKACLILQILGTIFIHSCYATTGDLQIFGWRFGLLTGDFLSMYLMRVFIVYWCFPFVCFSIEPTASHFNIFCLHFCLISSVSYDEWRIKTVFIIYS
jgi:hypothetical protein